MQEIETGSQHPDRDTHLHCIESQKQIHASADCPISNVAIKKQAFIGDFKNAGQGWCSHPIEVNVYDFPSDAEDAQ